MNLSPEKISHDLATVVKGNVYSDILHRVAFSTDASIYQVLPVCVVEPMDRSDVCVAVRYAAARGIPIASRGAGSGVAGESLCSGIVLSMSRYMNRIVRTSACGELVTCLSGTILENVNRHLASWKRTIGPDPSTANRATVGGCVANNSTGAHSLRYGYMCEYIEGVEAVLADGSIGVFGNDMDPSVGQEDPAGAIAAKCRLILSEGQDAVRQAAGRHRYNRSGYTLAGVCRAGDGIDMARLLAGSEGTLAVFTEITLRSVEVPAARALLELEFESLEKMASAVPIIIGCGPSACELMDGRLLEMARQALGQRYGDIMPSVVPFVLMVEHSGAEPEQVRESIEKTDRAVGSIACGRRTVYDPSIQQRLWKMRKDAVPLLYRKSGRRKPVPFIEDVSVPNEMLGRYIAGLEEIAGRYGMEMAYYGHAGEGELHVRPYLDLGDPEDVRKMLSVANEVFSLAWSLGGAISGEHADGLVRSAFLRRQYGDEFYAILGRIKNAFDPAGLMNPGKIISDASDTVVTEHLRSAKAGGSAPSPIAARAADEVRKCNGCGLCLSGDSSLRMCPVFRALGDELAGSRGKANVLRFLADGQMDQSQLDSRQFKRFLDMCINCKACSVQCPSGVDISKVIAAVRAQYARRRGLERSELLFSRSRISTALGSAVAPLANLLFPTAGFRFLMSLVAGVACQRRMPAFAGGSFLRAARRYVACRPLPEAAEKVIYFVDTYADYYDHELGFAVLGLLRHNDIAVLLPKQRAVPLPAIVYGNTKVAKKDLSFDARHLASAVRHAGNCKIVCSEPSAALCLAHEMGDFVGGPDAELVTQNTVELTDYLYDLLRKGRLKAPSERIGGQFLYHRPCHMLAIGGQGCVELLSELCGSELIELDAGCCGLSGTFGMHAKNYRISEKIGRGLTEAIRRSGVKKVVTECGSCKMQIEHANPEVKVFHPAKLIAAAYGL